MSKKYVIVDGMNIFFRAAHVVNPNAGIDNMIGMGFHIILNSMIKAWKDFGADHIVFCLEGRSWRKDIYPQYKANRAVARMAQTEAQQETSEIMIEAFNDFCEFIDTKTNVSVLQCQTTEADDLIAFWVDAHPNDQHVILSTDSDFLQLLAPNVIIYNGIEKTTTKLDGIYDEKGVPVLNKKTGLAKVPLDPDYFLFLKCIRGDKTDNVFSAFPGVREKGTKTKVGVMEAYADRERKGYAWNNFMLQRWKDHNDEERIVQDAYKMNRTLIDLRAQPEEVKLACAETLVEAMGKEPVTSVGIHFLKFCGRWDLKRISQNETQYANMLNAKYVVTS